MASGERGVEVVVKTTEVVTPILPLTVQRLPMLNLDLLFPPVDVGILFCYNEVSMKNEMIISMVKKGLSQVLVSFYSLAGELVFGNEGQPEILCNNRGVDFVQAIANMELQHLDLYKLDVSVYPYFLPVKKNGVLSIQVTEMRCGGLVIGCSFDHRVADAHSVGTFLVAWADMTRSHLCNGNKIASVSTPNSLHSFPHPRSTSHPDAAMDKKYALSETASSDSRQAPPLFHFQSRIYNINACQIQRLQSLAGPGRTKFESFSALLWKLLAQAATEEQKKCKLGIVVNGRNFLSKSASKNHRSLDNYFGNVFSIPYIDASVGELKSMPLSETADRVRACVESASSEEHFRGLVDWVESHRPYRAMYEIFSFHPSETQDVAVVISSGQHFPISKMNFGWGHPSFVSFLSPGNGTTTTGLVMPMLSATNNGDWLVFMHLPEKHLDFLEKEAPHIFKPFGLCPLEKFGQQSKL